MNKTWQSLSRRIDALSLRERVFLFLSLIAVCVAITDQVWLAPARSVHLNVKQRFAAESLELQRLREAVKAKASAADPAKLVREEIAAAKAETASVDAAIAMLAGPTRGTVNLQDVLVHFLRRHAALTLVKTGNLPGEVVAGGSGQPGQAGAAAKVAVVRQAMELTVAGPFAELVRYVETLERALPDLRWGTMKLAAEQQPPQLTLQVFLLAPQP
ncbi:MAG: hypothetical protein LH632_00845 [Rhodoferax sp.]|nr:hypothetical protein [Rhodoferax sp.]